MPHPLQLPTTATESLAMHPPRRVTAADQTLSLITTKGAPTVLFEAQHQLAPPWGFNLPISGRRNYQDVFRLACSGELIRKWVLTPNSSDDLAVPQNAIDHSATETTTVYRPNPANRRAGDKLRISSHWLLTPYYSFNGFTIGIIFMDMIYNDLDELSVGGAPSGKFAMNETTGEILATAFRGNGSFIVGWIQCTSSCERVREVLEFEAPTPGQLPRHIIKRNSFYERRNCKICGQVRYANKLPPPCTRIPKIRITDPTTFRNFGLKGFRGSYFGTCEKSLFDSRNNKRRRKASVPIYVDLRHSIPAVHEKLKLRLRKGLLSFGTAPRISSGLFVSDDFRYLLEAGGVDDPARLLQRRRRGKGAKTSAIEKKRLGITNGYGDVKGTLRRRNADEDNRDSIKFQRKRRNREAARRANEARRQRIASTKQELEHLKSVVVPQLKARVKMLRESNSEMRTRLESKPLLDDIDFLSMDSESFLASSDVTYEDMGDISGHFLEDHR